MAEKSVTVDANWTNKTTPSALDRLLLVDSDTTPNTLKDISANNFMAIISALTELTSPIVTDGMAVYDSSAGAPKMVLLSNLLKIITGHTEDTAPDGVADFLATYDTSASGAKKVRPVYLSGLYQQRGGMINGKLSVTVSSNDLVVAIKTLAGGDPSATDPVFVRIGDTVRSVTAATSMTLADATNWFASGSAETAAQEIDYFAYAVWDSNSSIVAVSAARVPYGSLVSDFSATTTNDRHLGNYANFTSTDEVEVIGRFAATLSAAAGHVWTVPTFTAINLIQRPIWETRRLTWAPTLVGYSAAPTNTVYQYVVDRRFVKIYIREGTAGTSSTTTLTMTIPLTPLTLSNAAWIGTGAGVDNGVVVTTALRLEIGSGSTTMAVYINMSASSVWTNANGKRVIIGNVEYAIG